ncbi:MAG: type 1 glutamine amidotransferase [Nitratireductor sp.]
MRVAVLDCCCPNPEELSQFASVGDLIIEWLQPHMEQAELVRIDAWGGETLPASNDFDGFIVSGSELGVYDETNWMGPVRQLLLDIREAGKPVFGICFGHQLMADTYGGKAEKINATYAAGTRRFLRKTGQQEMAGGEFDAYVLHGDQVTRIPPGARVTCAAGHCPVGALAYDFPAMSVQFHPEYERSYVEAVIDLMDGDLLRGGEVEASHKSMESAAVAPDLYAREVALFLREGVSGHEFVDRHLA